MIKISDLRNTRIFRTIRALWQRLRPQKITHTAEIAVETKTIFSGEGEPPPVDGISNATSIEFDGQDVPMGFASVEKSVGIIKQYYSTPHFLSKSRKGGV